jgi:hypothetical protein
MTTSELKSLLSQQESVTLEFKRRCPDPEVLAKLISAFANTLGGRIVLGVEDDGSIVGIEDLPLARRTIARANERIKPPVSTRLERVEIEGKEILVIDVDKGETPPHLVDERAYQRIGGAVIPSGAAFAPDVRGSAIQSVLGGSGAIAQGVGNVVAGKGGISVGRDLQVAGGQVTHVITYDAAFERVTGSTTFVLDQLEVSYRQTREQSQGWYRLSAIAAGIGFLLIIGGVVTVIVGQLTAGIITSVAGVIPEAAAALFFAQGKEANKRVDVIQEKLGAARELLTALEIANTISDEASRNEMKRSIVIKALGLEEGIG